MVSSGAGGGGGGGGGGGMYLAVNEVQLRMHQRRRIPRSGIHFHQTGKNGVHIRFRTNSRPFYLLNDKLYIYILNDINS